MINNRLFVSIFLFFSVTFSFLVPAETLTTGKDIKILEKGSSVTSREEFALDTSSIISAMASYKVPAVSFAVIENNEIARADAIGYINSSGSKEVDVNTLFQAGSISKSIFAILALSLVDSGLIDLDDNVEPFLGNWRIPNPKNHQNDDVTLRTTLSMSSGLGVGGYFGYSPGEPIPSLLETLGGKEPANSKPVVLTQKPTSAYEYSGGGYQVVQLITENISQMTAQRAANKFIFEPLAMLNSSYAQPTYDNLANVAQATDSDGKAFPYQWRVYPEYAAAGLWSTPTDLGKFIISINKAYRGSNKQIVSPLLARQSLSRQKNTPYGLGFVVKGQGDNLHFMKLGQNSGYQGWLVGLPNTGQGAVIMTNSDNGRDLAQALIYSIAETYHWPIVGQLEDAWMIK